MDETFGISCGTVEFPPDVTKTETPTKLQLSCKDKMFDKIRNKHFATIFSVLGVTAKQLAAAQVSLTFKNIYKFEKRSNIGLLGSSSQHVGDSNEAVCCKRVASNENSKQGSCPSYQCQ